MKILVEEYAYDKEVVRNVLPESHVFLTNGKVKIEYVGYYHNANSTAEGKDDFVFFLPKVVLNKYNRVFADENDAIGGFSPEDILDPDNVKTADGRTLSEEQRKFLYEFSVWIYRALAHYVETHEETDAVWSSNDGKSGTFRRKYVTNTFLDVILALIRFNRENQDYFLFKVKEKHSGLNKISWARTIARSQAFVSDGVPVYLEPVNKKRSIDFDEELLVLYYSILDYVRSHYGFCVKIGMGYELITGDMFQRYLDGYGAARLRQIKYKYFSDRDLMLWELCFAFFDKAHQANIASSGEDYLLAKSFDRVFEAMIDELLGDSQFALHKELADGKEIDHLYVDDSLTRTDGWRTLCIADSKYYKAGNSLNDESVPKQFTYARDMLQLDVDLFLYDEDDVEDSVKKRRKPFTDAKVRLLRDKVTEGYDIIPNFFISATMDEGLGYDDAKLRARHLDDGGEHHSAHFENRLFDRDTMILSHFDVNFLYVVRLYAQNDDGERAKWKREAREIFRKEIRGIIENRYQLYALMPHDGVDAQQFFQENFKYTSGKVYSPYPDDGGKPIYALALQNVDKVFPDKRLTPDKMFSEGDPGGAGRQYTRIAEENSAVKELIESAFYCVKIGFGENPRSALEKELIEHPAAVHGPAADAKAGVQVISRVAGPLTQAIRKSGKCPCPEDQCPDAASVRVLVVPFTQGAHLFRVADGVAPVKLGVDKLPPDFSSVKFPSPNVLCWVWDVVEE